MAKKPGPWTDPEPKPLKMPPLSASSIENGMPTNKALLSVTINTHNALIGLYRGLRLLHDRLDYEEEGIQKAQGRIEKSPRIPKTGRRQPNR